MNVILLTLVATFLIQLGFILWKVAAAAIPPIGKAPPLQVAWAMITNVKWLGGFVATNAGWILFINAANIGAISIVQPLMSVGDAFLVIMAFIFLKERLNRYEGAGLLLTVIGAAVLSLGITPIKTVTINWPDIALFFSIVGIIAGIQALLARTGRKPEIMLAIIVGIGFGTGAILTKLMTAYIAQDGIEPTAWDFVFNPILPLVIAANVVGLVTLQAAFQRGRASIVVPIQLAVANAIVVIAGVFLFHEIITIYHAIGILLILLGTLLMNYKKKAPTS